MIKNLIAAICLFTITANAHAVDLSGGGNTYLQGQQYPAWQAELEQRRAAAELATAQSKLRLEQLNLCVADCGSDRRCQAGCLEASPTPVLMPAATLPPRQPQADYLLPDIHQPMIDEGCVFELTRRGYLFSNAQSMCTR
jgi:hypothetical protein